MKKYKVILNYKLAVEIRAEDETRAIAYAMNAVDDAVNYCTSLNADVDIERRWYDYDEVKEVDDAHKE